MRIAIINGRVIDPSQNLDKTTNVYLSRGRILEVADQAPEGFSADQEIDAEGKWIIPGLVDLQARLGEPGSHYSGTIASETKAAVAGGITSICCPPDTSPINDTQAVTELMQRLARQAATAFVMPIGAMTQNLNGERLSNSYSLKNAGCVAISQANQPIQNALTLKNALEYNSTLNLPVMLRCEDQKLKNGGIAHNGPISSRLGLPENPSSAETSALARDLVLAEEAGIKVHFSQLSCARSVDMIADAKKRGLPVTCDVAIHQLILSEMDTMSFNSLYRVDPPLRSMKDKEALLNGVKMGIIDAIVSDHTPLDRDAKLLPYGESVPGMSSFETMLALLIKMVQEQQLDLITAIRAVTSNPADIINCNTGSLQNGNSADLCIIDPEAIWTLNPEEMISAGKNTPFGGWEFIGQVEQTFFQGRPVYRNNKI